jgi:hypothetical protein
MIKIMSEDEAFPDTARTRFQRTVAGLLDELLFPPRLICASTLVPLSINRTFFGFVKEL